MFLNQFSGSLVVLTYAADIFLSSGSSLSPNESSIIVAFIQLVGVYVSTLCVDRFGRKVKLNLLLSMKLDCTFSLWLFQIMMMISTTGASIFLTILATYSYLAKSGFQMRYLSWIPVTSLSCFIFLASLGIIALPFIIATELFPNKVVYLDDLRYAVS